MATKILDNYIPRPELAEELGRSVRTLEKWEAQGIGPPVTRIGRRTLYRIDAVKAWLKSREKQSVRERGSV